LFEITKQKQIMLDKKQEQIYFMLYTGQFYALGTRCATYGTDQELRNCLTKYWCGKWREKYNNYQKKQFIFCVARFYAQANALFNDA
jgi:hypothetical protein